MINIDVISGFLGAGKTTFCNMLLKYYLRKGQRPVYIVNEFGQTGLDALIIEAEGFNAVEMEGGCVCCTLKDDITVSMLQVIEAFAPTHIVFEPSGIFIFDNFEDILKEPKLASLCEIKNTITLVDSINFNFARVAYGSFIYNQIKNAPVIILSKLEKNVKDTPELICDIKNINPNAIITSKVLHKWGEGDFDAILNKYKQPGAYECISHHQHLASVSVEPKANFLRDEIAQLASHCKDGVFGDIYRVKGVITVDGRLMLLNIARGDFSLVPFKGAAKQSLTFIGNSVNEDEIARQTNGLTAN